MTSTAPVPAPVGKAVPETADARGAGDRRKLLAPARIRQVRNKDRVIVALMVGVPTVLVLGLVWLPAIATVILSFASWDGIGGLSTIKWVGFDNYDQVLHNYPPFQPAIKHNLIWLVVTFTIPTLLGIFLAVLLDRELRGGRFYQTAFFLPVVLSLALVGFIWQLLYSRDQGLINYAFGSEIDWYGDSKYNLWAVLGAFSWKHTGYVMLLYLAGLKGVDPSLREAAAIDGAGEVKTFFRVVLPVMRPINIVVLVITVIESLRAFDLVWVVNKGRNGLELISALVTQNIIGEASRIGFGSALATFMLVISLVFITVYLATIVRDKS